MAASLPTRKEQRYKLLRAVFLNPRNLFVLAIGLAAGLIAPFLILFAVMAYGILCYLDLSSDDFVRQVLYPEEARHPQASEGIRSFSEQEVAQTLEAEELRRLSATITASYEKIQRFHQQADPFLQNIFGDLLLIDNLVEHSKAFLFKAQTIQNYLASEDLQNIQRDIASLEEKIQQVSDDFSQQQYRQALDARQKHLESLRDIQKIYERLLSQLTNISISLDSIYSRLMKLKSSDYAFQSTESEQVSTQLNHLLHDVERLDAALQNNLGLEEKTG